MADKIIPITPEEKLLAKAGGQNVEIPVGNTRITKLLQRTGEAEAVKAAYPSPNPTKQSLIH